MVWLSWTYRLIALALAIGVVDYIVRQKSVTRQVMGALVLVPLVLRAMMIR